MIERAHRIQQTEEYYFSKKLKEVAILQSQGYDIINLGIGSPDLLPENQVVETLKTALNDAKAHQYQSYQGLPELRAAFLDYYHQTYHIAESNQIACLPLMGSKEGIMHISLTFLNQGDGVLIPNPGYPTYEAVTKLVQAKPLFYDLLPENNYQPNFEALERFDLSKVKIMWVNYPHMPTGTLADDSTFEKLIAFGLKHQILIVNDNPYSTILNSHPTSIFDTPNADKISLELNSLSKSFNLSGWRVGVVIGHQHFLDDIIKIKSNFDSGMFYGIQKGAISALKLSHQWNIELNNIYQSRKELIFELATLLNLDYQKNNVGLFVWCKINASKNSEEFTDDLLICKHIFVTPGHIFGTNGEGYVKFSLCTDEKAIKKAIKRLQHD